mmetsp:Transcript_39592/g.38124  ORF Transcript_39592/g.38124 Transcript_39592/m.38124 type:complete len:256 (+) Transcript_39592:569-1336(+)
MVPLQRPQQETLLLHPRPQVHRHLRRPHPKELYHKLQPAVWEGDLLPLVRGGKRHRGLLHRDRSPNFGQRQQHGSRALCCECGVQHLDRCDFCVLGHPQAGGGFIGDHPLLLPPGLAGTDPRPPRNPEKRRQDQPHHLVQRRLNNDCGYLFWVLLWVLDDHSVAVCGVRHVRGAAVHADRDQRGGRLQEQHDLRQRQPRSGALLHQHWADALCGGDQQCDLVLQVEADRPGKPAQPDQSRLQARILRHYQASGFE